MMSITIPRDPDAIGNDNVSLVDRASTRSPTFTISSLLNPVAYKQQQLDMATTSIGASAFAKDLTGAYGLLDLRRDAECFLSSCRREATVGGLCVEHTCKVQGCRNFSIHNDMCQFHNTGVTDGNDDGALTTPRMRPGAFRLHHNHLPSLDVTSPMGKSSAVSLAAASVLLANSSASKTYVRSRYCKISECHKLRHKNGLCVAHGGGWYCKVDGCTKHSKAKGLCSAHGGIHYCRIDGCTKYRKKKGLCIAHGRGLFGRSDSMGSDDDE
ncbi:hypothetical protein H310_05169 [Aphanomyces invadans]|uniref:Uncharacterized protein n=1 Tax=Aphanomyces invadans TaxID=157072 RepID=A0A024UBZ6_9STRA|nr:hypothetical protein H310_05169 [Aphanomyces invadans]ETW03804.1 hypothetical protein H310_05169 [Aphanomyces invadans]|eukprot:XP_008868033.1 hypothetical protein H310_05169 [Aphanomyces invadans]